MDTENPLDSPKPGDVSLVLPQPASPGTNPDKPRQCSSLTKAGSRCKMKPLSGQTVCLAHSPGHSERSKQASEASARIRKDRVSKRKEDQETAKLSLTEAFRLAAGKRQTELVNATLDRAIIEKDPATLRLVWERLEGKVADHLVTDAADPWNMDAGALAKWIDLAEHGTTPDPSDTNA